MATLMILTACTVCGAVGSARQTKGGQQAKNTPQVRRDPRPDAITDAYLLITGPSRHYYGIHCGMEYGASTSGNYTANGNRMRSFTLPPSTVWTFHTKINGEEGQLEFKHTYFDNDRGSSHWTFTPTEEGLHEITATATYMEKSHSSDTMKIHVLPPRDWTGPISLFNNGEAATDNVVVAGRHLLGEHDWPEMHLYAQGPVCVKWHHKSATGTFMDHGGEIHYIAINHNNNCMSLDPKALPAGDYSLSVPCEQEGADGKVHTVTHEFTVRVLACIVTAP